MKKFKHNTNFLFLIEIDQTMTARHLAKKLCRKDDLKPGPEWCIAEKLPALCMDRILQDSEHVYETVCDWNRNIDNHFVFLKRNNRHRLFCEPHSYLSTDPAQTTTTTTTTATTTQTATPTFTAESKKALLEDYFSKEATQVPSMEGVLWLREGSKKWIKHFFMLRPSGIYYTPKGKRKSRELSLLASFEHYTVYTCQGYRNNFKAPTDHVFALKHPRVQTPKSKHVHVMCVGSRDERNRWMTFIRMAKYGYAMYADYLTTKEDELRVATGRTHRTRSVTSDSEKGGSIHLVMDGDSSGSSSLKLTSSANSSPSTSRHNNTSPSTSRHEFNQVLSATFPRRSKESSPKTSRLQQEAGSLTLPKISAMHPRTLLTSTTSAPPDLLPPPPPPLGSIPREVPHGVKRKTRRKKKSETECGDSGGSTSSTEQHQQDEPADKNM